MEINLKKYEKIKQKINDLEEINFTQDEVDLIYKLAGFDLLSVSEMRALILLFTEKPNA